MEIKQDISKLKKLFLDASELQYGCTNFYDAIYIVPKYTDGHISGYRDLNIYGINKTNRYEHGYCAEKIGTSDHIRVNSLFKKLKHFQISIDMPYLENIIRIYCRDHLIRVTGLNFDFVKNKRRWYGNNRYN